jgi:7-keto-8-aminopelargonate synthetase-like enzyme
MPSPSGGETVAVMQSAPGPETVIDGRRYLYFGGTGYLGLAGHPEVLEAACEAVRRYGLHTATSRSGFGTSPPTLEVERRAAEFFGREAAFYFVSGYVGNHIVIQALAGRFETLFADEAAHYSLEEASRLSGRPIVRFRHADPDDLERLLRLHCGPEGRPLVLTDGIFAASGDIAPLDQYIKILGRYEGASLLVDDAHGFGTLGEAGRGTFEHFGFWGPGVNSAAEPTGTGLFVAGTLSKALGGFGGILAGSDEFIRLARSSSHYYEGASALPAPVAGAAAKALEIVLREPQLRARLRENVSLLRQGLRDLGLSVADSPSPVIGLAVGDARNMRRLHAELKEKGILVPYFPTYSGTSKEGLLRIAVCAAHTVGMLEQLLGEMARIL